MLAMLATILFVLKGQAQEQPAYLHFQFDDNAIINNLSDNGLWAAAHGSNASNTLLSTGPRRLDLYSGTVKELTAGLNAAEVASAAAYDVTDDGRIVVGDFNGVPAYWSEADGKWHTLALGKGCAGGYAASVTPDGKWAVGLMSDAEDIFQEKTALWDLATGKLVETPGIPTLDMAHEDKGQNRFTAISADGNLILGCMSVSYLPTSETLGGRFNYIYNISTKSYTPIGFTETKTGRWNAHAEGLMFLSTAQMSSNGKYVTGAAYMAKPVEGSDFPNEYQVPFVYDTQADQFVIYDTQADEGIGGWTIGNDGTMLGATPINNPFREWSIRSGKYWYDVRHVLQEKYGFNLLQQVGIDNSGTPLAVSNDGTRIAVLVDPYSSYILQLPEPLNKVCEGINLLSNYTVTPAAGSGISKLLKAQIAFDRNIDIIGSANSAELRDASGTTLYRSVGFKEGDNQRTLDITFRRGDFNDGGTYTLYIPEGTIQVAGDASQKNRPISISYKGRNAAPVYVTEVYPEENAAFAKLDAATNPILLTFDTQVKVPEAVYAQLYHENEHEPISQLALSYGGNQVAVYPLATQYLYKNASYRVVIPAGTITDVTGNNANEEITLHYKGTYEREVSFDDKTLFRDDFSNGLTAFLLYDGDRLTPTQAMQAWGFADAQNFPWILVRDNESSTDMAAAAHSMYEEGGQAQDWMVTPQIYLPDDRCVLQFKSQSYLDGAGDRLKVLVWENEQVHQYLTDDLTARILQEATKVYDREQSVGTTEEGLDNEWTETTVNLSAWAGKSVYIAFLNDNENGSAVFVDDVEVMHNMPFLVTFDHVATVTAKSAIDIYGRVTIDDESKTFTQADLTLKDAQGNVVDEIHESGLSLGKGQTLAFRFAKQLPLAAGRENAFSVDIRMNDETSTVKGSVKNLAFEPLKRVVLEEFSGMTCQNCPLGILAVEKIKSIHGDRFIPLVLHTYQGDQLGTGLEGYSAYFNFSGAPQGMIQRNGILSAPMVSVSQDYRFNGVNGDKLWLDLVNEEMSTAAEAGIEATAAFADESQTGIVVNSTVRYALDAEGKNVNLFLAVLEDDVTGYQYNNLYNMTDPDLGEWGEGGKYAQSTIYPYQHQHVVRSWSGRTVTGTGGYIPSTVEANTPYAATLTTEVPATVSNKENLHVVVMMIDADTERVINAAAAPVKGIASGIETTEGDIDVRIVGNTLVARQSGNCHVEAFTPDGRRIGSVQGSGTLRLSLPEGQHLFIVKTNGKILKLKK